MTRNDASRVDSVPAVDKAPKAPPSRFIPPAPASAVSPSPALSPAGSGSPTTDATETACETCGKPWGDPCHRFGSLGTPGGHQFLVPDQLAASPREAGGETTECGAPFYCGGGTRCERPAGHDGDHHSLVCDGGFSWPAAPSAAGPRHLNGVSFETFRDVANGVDAGEGEGLTKSARVSSASPDAGKDLPAPLNQPAAALPGETPPDGPCNDCGQPRDASIHTQRGKGHRWVPTPWWRREHTEAEREAGVIRDLKLHSPKDTTRVCAQALNLIRDITARLQQSERAREEDTAGLTLDEHDEAGLRDAEELLRRLAREHSPTAISNRASRSANAIRRLLTARAALAAHPSQEPNNG